MTTHRQDGKLETGRYRHPHAKAVLPRNRPARQKRIAATLASIDIDHGRESLREVFTTARSEAIESGFGWHPDAHQIARSMTSDVLSIDQAAGIIAALSPQRSWAENITLADSACAGEDIDGIGDQIDKVDRILAGADPTAVLGGRKVRSFHPNIARPLCPGAVTVDRHMISAFVGRPLSDAEASEVLNRIGGYQIVAAVIRGLAREYGVLPHEFQAIVWCEWRLIHAPGWAARDELHASLQGPDGLPNF